MVGLFCESMHRPIGRHRRSKHKQPPASLSMTWHFIAWLFPVANGAYIFQIKYTEAVLPNSTRKLLWFEITKMLIAV